MKIDQKDRGQLLRMAGNIAGGLVHGMNVHGVNNGAVVALIANLSARIALQTMEELDRQISERNKDA